MPSISLLLQKPYLPANNDGKKPLNPKETRIYAFLIISKQAIVKIKTEHVIKPTEWDFDKQLKKDKLAGAAEFNLNLLSLKMETLAKYEELTNDNHSYSFEQISQKLKRGKSLIIYLDEFIEAQKNRLAPRTIQKFNTLKTTLEEFAEAKPKYQPLTFSMINHSFLEDFVNHLRVRKPRGKQKSRPQGEQDGLLISTIRKYIESIIFFLKWAEEKGYNKNLEYKKFKEFSFLKRAPIKEENSHVIPTAKKFMEATGGNLKIWLTQAEGKSDKSQLSIIIIKAWNRLLACTDFGKSLKQAADHWIETIYVLRHPMDNNLYKIGVTDNFPKRYGNHCTGVGGMPDIILVLELHRPLDVPAEYVESFLHEFFKERRVIGEWFTLSSEMLEAIKRLFYKIGIVVYGENEEIGLPPDLKRIFVGPGYCNEKYSFLQARYLET